MRCTAGVKSAKPLKVAGGPIALVLVPTRELALQIHGIGHKLYALFQTRCIALLGGTRTATCAVALCISPPPHTLTHAPAMHGDARMQPCGHHHFEFQSVSLLHLQLWFRARSLR